VQQFVADFTVHLTGLSADGRSVGRSVRARRHWPGQRSRACASPQSDERANMEVDVLMFSTSDQQQRSDENILATIEGALTDDQAMSELATAESPIFDESRADDDDPVTSQDERLMLAPDDSRSEVVPGTDNIGQFEDESAGFSDVCVSPGPLLYQTRSGTFKSQEEETSNGDTVDMRNSTDCDVDTVSAVDCVVSSASHNEYDPSGRADDVSKTACSVTESYHNHAETESDPQSPQGGLSEMSGVSCAEMTSSVSVIDTYAVVDSSDVISDVDSTLIVNLPDKSTENVPVSCSADALSEDNTHQTDGLSDEAVRLETTEAIDTDSKKGFRVRFPKDHVTGYLDPPTPWREGWHQFRFCAYALQWRIITCC